MHAVLGAFNCETQRPSTTVEDKTARVDCELRRTPISAKRIEHLFDFRDWPPVEDWPSDELVKILCRVVLKLEPERCQLERNLTDGSPAFEVIWSRLKN